MRYIALVDHGHRLSNGVEEIESSLREMLSKLRLPGKRFGLTRIPLGVGIDDPFQVPNYQLQYPRRAVREYWINRQVYLTV